MIVDRAFRLAVQAFPREYRATRRDEIIDTFAEMSMSGGQVLIELWWVALAGLRMRFSPSSQVQQAILPSVRRRGGDMAWRDDGGVSLADAGAETRA
jgi:hypothetical protein